MGKDGGKEGDDVCSHSGGGRGIAQARATLRNPFLLAQPCHNGDNDITLSRSEPTELGEREREGGIAVDLEQDRKVVARTKKRKKKLSQIVKSTCAATCESCHICCHAAT